MSPVPTLDLPTLAAHTSFLEAMAEFRAEGRGGADDDTMIGRDLREYGARWHDPAVFAAYVDKLLADRLEETPRAASWVPCTTWWWLDGAQFIGRIALRHRLNAALTAVGGHIGYDVRPSARRRGHATAMLRAVLREAGARGITEALVTCDVDNVGSRRVIAACGGRLEDQRGHKLRFWIATSGQPSSA
jgi:predicted acetyltransferase